MNETASAENQVLDSLRKAPLFSQLDDRNLRKLAKLCTLKNYAAGDVIYEEGAIGLSVFVVTSGRAESYKSVDGRKVKLGVVEAGGVLGEVALLDDSPRSASVAALEATACLLLTRDSFETLVKKEPQIAWCLVPSLAGRVRQLQALRVESELELEMLKGQAAAATAPAAEKAATKKAETGAAKEHEDRDEDEDEDDDESSDLEGAFFKMMRMQYGLLAGGAKGMTEMAKMMETFIDSLAEETDFKVTEDWRELLESTPDAMVTATRKAMDKGDKAAQEMIDAYRRYSEAKD
jgi:CRP/FNR family cyclic AMP-dependent transcriptional regulator